MRKILQQGKSKGQIAIEFLLLTTFGVFFLIAILLVLNKISSDNASAQRDAQLYDLGTSLKNELSSASEMENGYHRIIHLPQTVKGHTYTITFSNGTTGNSYLILNSDNLEYLFSIPKTSGTIGPGENTIIKSENLSVINTP